MSTEKMTDERALALRDILEAHGWTDAQAEEAWAEFDRARRSEVEKNAALQLKDAEIARLCAELDRLKPSGQVAEDRALIDKVMGFSTYDAPLGAGLAALSRLTAWAQAAHVLAGALGKARIAVIDGHVFKAPYTGSGFAALNAEIDAALSLVRNP